MSRVVRGLRMRSAGCCRGLQSWGENLAVEHFEHFEHDFGAKFGMRGSSWEIEDCEGMGGDGRGWEEVEVMER